MKFQFSNDTEIYFGKGQIKAVAGAVPAGSKVLLIYGGGSIKQNGVYDQVAEALSGFEWGEFEGVEPNPQYDTLMRAVELIRAEGYDYLLAVGGGSVVDGVKFISAAACYRGEDPWELLTEQLPVEEVIPLSCVLTLPATGSESNGGAVITRGEDKLFFGSPLLLPRFAILDPETTLSLPQEQIANGVADAYVHVVEQYFTYPVGAKVQDRFAEGLLLTLLEEGARVLTSPDCLEVRSNIMWAATLALNGLIGAGVPQDWTTHMIGHELTALHGVDHGRSLTIILPAVMRVRREQKHDKLLQYAERIFGLTSGSEEERIDEAIALTERFFQQLELPVRLSDIGLGETAIPALIANLEKHGRLAMGEHGDVDLKIAELILETAV